jgi:hypothetical protein
MQWTGQTQSNVPDEIKEAICISGNESGFGQVSPGKASIDHHPHTLIRSASATMTLAEPETELGLPNLYSAYIEYVGQRQSAK